MQLLVLVVGCVTEPTVTNCGVVGRLAHVESWLARLPERPGFQIIDRPPKLLAGEMHANGVCSGLDIKTLLGVCAVDAE